MTTPKDNFNIEPYIYLVRNTGSYDKNWKKQKTAKFWSYQFQLPMQVGLNSLLEITLTPEVFHNRIDASPQLGLASASSTQFADFPVTLGVQILRGKMEDWYPSIGIQFTETFPTGRFEHLDPLKRKMDVGGAGTYATTTTFLVSKLFHVHGDHGDPGVRTSVAYLVGTSVKVEGFNSYGGGFDTKGCAHPGHSLQGLIGLEYGLTLNWAVAIDFDYLHINKSTFKGNPGTILGVPATMGFPSSESSRTGVTGRGSMPQESR